MDIQYDKVLWDGLILDIYHDKQITKLTRNDILEYMPELDIDEIKKWKLLIVDNIYILKNIKSYASLSISRN